MAPAGEGARMVVVTPGVGVDVLDVVEEHDGPQRKHARDGKHQEPQPHATRPAMQPDGEQ